MNSAIDTPRPDATATHAVPLDKAGVARANRRLAVILGCVALAFVGFGFALVPLYDVFCRIVGINVPAQTGPINSADHGVDYQRRVTVSFTSQVMAGLPVVFKPEQKAMQVHPGELILAQYRIRNLSSTPLRTNAVYNLSPGFVGKYFHKIECFCFREQTLAPGEDRLMPVAFRLARNIDAHVTDITLSYTFYEAPKQDGRG